MGLNMPAKAVVFTQVSKWDGESHRVMTAGEYTQMSGRAGRRGMDEFGLAIVMIDGSMDATQCEEMMLGKASPLVRTLRSSASRMRILCRRLCALLWTSVRRFLRTGASVDITARAVWILSW
jgi:superfamily II RNA helicase